jgi:hypothetical protein
MKKLLCKGKDYLLSCQIISNKSNEKMLMKFISFR